MTWKQRYQHAHEKDFQTKYPQAYRDGHYSGPKIPDVKTSNGLTKAVVNFLNWEGHKADRISTTGQARKIVEGGMDAITGKYKSVERLTFVRGNVTKGKADVGSTLDLPNLSPYGISVDWEVKIGRDKLSDFQINEQLRMHKVKGFYFVVKTIDDFFNYYDGLTAMQPQPVR